MNRRLASSIFAASLLTALAGCQSTPEPETSPAPVEDRSGATAPRDSSVGSAPRSGVGGSQLGMDPTQDPNNILSKHSVFFDYDSNSVKEEYKPVVTAHGNYLRDNRERRLVIQGNTDERGSAEYNLALGQRRADSVKQMMLLLGARENQIESVSFGKEKPRDTGHDDSAWAENRRADIEYQAR